MSNRKDIFIRSYVIYFAFVIVMLVVLFKTISIQFEGGKPYFLASSNGTEKVPTRIVKRVPRRGQILDINYIPLVSSVSFYDIHMDPTVVDEDVFNDNVHQLSTELGQLFKETSAQEFEKRIRDGRKRGSRYVLIKKKATNEQRKKLKQMPIFKLSRFKGGLIDNEEIIVRKRPHGELLRRTLGYSREVNGKLILRGLEGAYNDYLTGEPGEDVEQKISTGWKKIGPIIKEPVEGSNVVTTIDKEIQEVAHNELMNQLVNQKAESGCVIVMDVKTGYIKAIVNLLQAKDGNYYESFNKAIGTKEVPGSTFKLASLMAALEDNKVSINDIVNAKGVYTFYNTRLKDSHEGGYGRITIQEAFEKSSNVFSEIINNAYRDNPQQFIDRLKSFGLADSLGISIKGEPKPTLREPGMTGWSGLSLPWMAIGYEVQQTPLQTLTFYNAVANNGKMMKPQFVKEIFRGNDIVKTYKPEVMIDHLCSQRTINDLKKCLEGVVKEGTGMALQSAFFDIAGKTGTAQILDDKNQKKERKYQASFCGYFPAENPVYSCIVVVTGPTKNIYGSVVSGSVFNAIANKVYASSLQYHKPVNAEEKALTELPVSKDGNKYDLIQIYKAFNIPFKAGTESTWVNTNSTGTKMEMNSRKVQNGIVPNVYGMTAKDAVFLLDQRGLTVKVKGYGRVVNQTIEAGAKVIKGEQIEIELR